jgi:hypothetical protein
VLYSFIIGILPKMSCAILFHSLTSHRDYRSLLFLQGTGKTMSAMKLLPWVFGGRGTAIGKINRTWIACIRLFRTKRAWLKMRNPWMAVCSEPLVFHQWDGKNTAELGKFTHCIVDAGVCWSSR